MNKIKLALVDDHPMFRWVFGTMLRRNPAFDLMLEATSSQEFIARMATQIPDVVLLDLGILALDGPATVSYLRSHWPQLKVIMLIMPGDESAVKPLLELGVCAYISKGAAFDNIRRTIQAVFDGDVFKTELVWRVVRRRMTRQLPEIKPN